MSQSRSCSPLRSIISFVPFLAGAFLLFAAGSKLPQLREPSPALFAGAGKLNVVLLICIIAIEGAVALELFFADKKRASVHVAIGLFLAFTGYILWLHFVAGKPCGCGAGEQFFDTMEGQFRFSMARNLALLVGLVAFALNESRDSDGRLLDT